MADLGMSPLANSYVRADAASAPERYFPLRAMVCSECFLVQLEDVESPEAIFSDYAYFSSYSSSWLTHAAEYAAQMCASRELGENSLVVEVASNDGYLLRNFVARGVAVLGIEPAANVAAVATENGIDTRVDFFGRDLAEELASSRLADLIVANNVLAHVPDINDFVAGLAVLLSPDGLLTVEFPHLLELVRNVQYDTIYHEHYSYLSLMAVRRVFAAHGLDVVDVERLTTHGGSLRVHAVRSGSAATSPRVEELLAEEVAAGLGDVATYTRFDETVRADKRDSLDVLIAAKREGLSIACYGAPAKGNTFLNYCGIGRDFVDFTVDASPHKQGTLLPGSRIPVLDPSALRERRPHLVMILPWNLRDEIVAEHAYVREWGGRFVARTPSLQILA